MLDKQRLHSCEHDNNQADLGVARMSKKLGQVGLLLRQTHRIIRLIEERPILENSEKNQKIISLLADKILQLLSLGGMVRIIRNENTLVVPENDPIYTSIQLFQAAVNGIIEAIDESQQICQNKERVYHLGIGGAKHLVEVSFSHADDTSTDILPIIINIIQGIIDRLHLICQIGFGRLYVLELLTINSTNILTGIANRRAMEGRIASLKNTSEKEYSPASVIMLDIDHFKNVNDTHGHQAGDIVLELFARLLAQIVEEYFGLDAATRIYNIPGYHPKVGVFRIGGEEFSIVLSDCNQEQASAIAEILRERIHEYKFSISDTQILLITSSVGVATVGNSIESENLIIQADTALYAAKEGGRNRVVIFKLPEESGSIEPNTTAPVFDRRTRRRKSAN